MSLYNFSFTNFKVNTIRCGIIKNNNYIIIRDRDCIIIDMTDATPIIEKLKKLNLNVLGVVLTHSHWDHLTGVDDFLEVYPVPVYMSSARPNYIDNHEFFYTEEKYNFKTHYNAKTTFLDEDTHTIGPFTFALIRVPGHTFCSAIIHFVEDKVMFTGDFVFKNTIGITTTKYSDPTLMVESLKKFITYDKDTMVFPGHGPYTTIGKELLNNPFIKNLN